MSLRIVSLLPSEPEIVCALGLRGTLVGVSELGQPIPREAVAYIAGDTPRTASA